MHRSGVSRVGHRLSLTVDRPRTHWPSNSPSPAYDVQEARTRDLSRCHVTPWPSPPPSRPGMRLLAVWLTRRSVALRSGVRQDHALPESHCPTPHEDSTADDCTD